MHCVQALIGVSQAIGHAAAAAGNAPTVRLTAGFAALPLTPEVAARFARHCRTTKQSEPLLSVYAGLAPRDETVWDSFMSAELLELAAHASQAAPVAYIETQYWGGEGYQIAMAWAGGQVIYGPTMSDKPGPINTALHHIGVNRTAAQDEFDLLGLSRFRSMDDFAQAATAPA